MRTEADIKALMDKIIDGIKAGRKDLETEIYGQKKKYIPPIRGEWLQKINNDFIELYLLAWILEEPLKKEILELRNLDP